MPDNKDQSTGFDSRRLHHDSNKIEPTIGVCGQSVANSTARAAADAQVVAAMHAWAAEMEAAPPGSATAFVAAELARRMAAAYAPLPPELAPQPPPANPPRGEPVWPLVIAEAEAGGEDPRLVALMRARHEQGIAKYGVLLSTHDGRNTAMDALQEALDLIVYLRKRRAEGRSSPHYWQRNVSDVAVALIDEIERER